MTRFCIPHLTHFSHFVLKCNTSILRVTSFGERRAIYSYAVKRNDTETKNKHALITFVSQLHLKTMYLYACVYIYIYI